MITLKSRREIEQMRPAGLLVAEAHRLVASMIRPGITTGEIDRAVEALFQENSAIPLFKGFPGPVPFPAVCCMSVNEEVVHGIPSDRVLVEGDIISVDTGCKINGWCGDSAWSYPVGQVDEKKQKLLEVGEASLLLSINAITECKLWSEVAAKLEGFINQNGFSSVVDFVGHGIGKEMHEDPQVPHYVDKGTLENDFELRPGLVIAIEPMVNAGAKEVLIAEDYWTVQTIDGEPSVHFEHTVAITSSGPEILTPRLSELTK
ncbi:MAG: type I methionyl aminopeptidase [Planctomycetaceae bacterium]|nr:type I methionyl aminopeptidase [Planctomycetaceae bacterium]